MLHPKFAKQAPMQFWGALLGAFGGWIGGSGTAAAIGTAVGTAAGAYIDSESAKDYQEGVQGEANQFNSAQAQLNRNFQERMARNSYQYGMEDMRKAGLNPMLAYSQGGAHVPAGAMASYATGAGPSHLSAAASMRSSDASVASAGAAVRQADTAANIGDQTVMKIKQEIVNMKTDNERGQAVIENLREEYQNLVKQGYNLTEVGNHLRATVDKLRAEIPLVRSQVFLNDARETLTMLEQKAKSVEIDLRKLDLEAATDLGNLGRNAQQMLPLFQILRMVLSQK